MMLEAQDKKRIAPTRFKIAMIFHEMFGMLERRSMSLFVTNGNVLYKILLIRENFANQISDTKDDERAESDISQGNSP